MRQRIVASHDDFVTLLGIKLGGGSLPFFQANLCETVKRTVIRRTVKQRQLLIVPAQRKILSELAQKRGVTAKGLH